MNTFYQNAERSLALAIGIIGAIMFSTAAGGAVLLGQAFGSS